MDICVYVVFESGKLQNTNEIRRKRIDVTIREFAARTSDRLSKRAEFPRTIDA